MRKKEEKRNNNKALLSLYLNYVLNRKTIIAIFICLIALSFALLYISNIDNQSEYIANSLSFHQSYFNLSLLMLSILNGIIIAFIVINLSINSISFDILFISYIKRSKLSIIKILTILIILFFLLTIEFSIVMLIALLRFECFKITNKMLLSFYYNYIVLIFEALVSLGLTEIFNLIITPLFVTFGFLIIRILMNNYEKIKDVLFDYIPYLVYNSKENIFEFGNSLVAGVLIISLIFLYIQIYSIKDLK